MKVLTITLALGGFLAVTPFANTPLTAALGNGTALADASLTSPYPMQPQETFATWVRKRNALMALRDEMIRLQAQDGGKLTQAHHDYLQVKMNAIMSGNY